jgi:hypothetical protein
MIPAAIIDETGNQEEMKIRKIPVVKAVGSTTRAMGSHATAGMIPVTLMMGESQ